MTSQLGGLAGDEGFDAVELSRHANLEAWRDKNARLAVVIRSSDAHYLGDIALSGARPNSLFLRPRR